MNKTWLKVLCVFWLVAVTPLFGLIPLWCIVTGGTGTRALCLLEKAFLLDVWLLFFPDPEYLGVSDASPPLTDMQWLTMISIALGGAIVALYYCYKWRIATKRQRMNVID
jgi:hypothetical protein